LNERIGELLVKQNLLTTEQLRKAREEAKSHGHRLGAQITKLGYLQENQLSEFVAKQYGVPDVNLDEFDIDPAVIQLIPEEVAVKLFGARRNAQGRRQRVAFVVFYFLRDHVEGQKPFAVRSNGHEDRPIDEQRRQSLEQAHGYCGHDCLLFVGWHRHPYPFLFQHHANVAKLDW
jgi:hypothetical protein